VNLPPEGEPVVLPQLLSRDLMLAQIASAL
jgi:hypothetical protein